MTTPPKSASSAAGSGTATGVTFRVAIVGAATLKGQEIKEVLEQGSFPALDIKLLDHDEALGQLEAVGDEPAFIQSVEREAFQHLDFAFFTSDAEFTRRHVKLAREGGVAVIDLSYALEDEADATVRAPWIEQERGHAVPPFGTVVIAHPAAVVLALLLLRARRAAAPRLAVATVFEPASEHGRRGMDELHQQTVNLLSFQPLPRDVYDAQIAFNLLSCYGSKSEATLESVERRIARHLRTIAGDGVDAPSLVLVQAPIFHAHILSLYIEFGTRVSGADLARALAGPHVTVVPAGDELPNNVGAAGQDTILVSVRPDAVHENALWLWAAADNLRLAAVTAVDCAAALAGSRGAGR